MVYLSAIEEGKHYIAQANVALTKDNKFAEDMVIARNYGDVLSVPRDKIDYRGCFAEAAGFGCRGAHPVP